MIIATVTKRWWGIRGRNENPNTLFIDVNFSTDVDIPSMGLKAGDVITSVRDEIGEPLRFSNPLDESRIINDWVNQIAIRLQDQSQTKETPYIVSLNNEQPEVSQLDEAQSIYFQKRQALITAKQDLDIGLIAKQDFDNIQADTLSAKASLLALKG
jgi:hypothetical protein